MSSNNQQPTNQPEPIEASNLKNHQNDFTPRMPQVHDQVRGSIEHLQIEDESEFPVERYRQEIIESLRQQDVLVVSAETGAGKSTQIPQFLIDEGYKVIVTQPRRIAARNLAEWVAQQRGAQVGSEQVGYHTGEKKMAKKDTQLIYCTDGLQLMRELMGSRVQDEKSVIVIDEAHEWNINIETLVAWVKMRKQNGAPFKVVLMSATMDADKLAGFYAGKEEKKEPAKTIQVPGKTYPVEEILSPQKPFHIELQEQIKEGKNILIFRPGKKELEETISEASLACPGAIVLPLHSQLDSKEQKAAFKKYPQPKIVVATNIAQTSVTIPDIDVVFDDGKEKRIEMVNGIEGLALKPISKADCLQRKGRAGRTKPGKYFLYSDVNWEERRDFPVPEIQNTRLDLTMLRLAEAGIKMEELEFFHQPHEQDIQKAHASLISLGAIDKEGVITNLGRKMARLPLSPMLSRTIIEAEKRGCVDQVLTISAILEVGGILTQKFGETHRAFSDEVTSEHILQLEAWEKCQGLSRQELMNKNIHAKNFFRVKEHLHLLRKALKRIKIHQRESDGTTLREDIIKSLMVGMKDHIYVHNTSSYISEHDQSGRKLSRHNILSLNAKVVLATPKDIHYRKHARARVMGVLEMPTAINSKWLEEVFPGDVQKVYRVVRWDRENEEMFQYGSVYFSDHEIRKCSQLPRQGEEAARGWARAIMMKSTKNPKLLEIAEHNEAVEKRIKSYLDRTEDRQKYSYQNAEQWLFDQLKDHSPTTYSHMQKLIAEDGFVESLKCRLEDIIPLEDQQQIDKALPATTEVNGEVREITYKKGHHGVVAEVRYTWKELLNSTSSSVMSTVSSLPSGQKLVFKTDWHGYDLSADNYVGLRSKCRAKHLENWRYNNYRRVEPQKFDDVLNPPSLPDPITLEETTIQLFPAYSVDKDNNCAVEWFESSYIAQRNNDSFKKHQELVVKSGSLESALADGIALRDFSGRVEDSGSSRESHWVIGSEGVLKKGKYVSKRTVSWDLIDGRKGDLLVRWNCSLFKELKTHSTCEILIHPVAGINEQQRAALLKIESELGLPEGSFEKGLSFGHFMNDQRNESAVKEEAQQEVLELGPQQASQKVRTTVVHVIEAKDPQELNKPVDKVPGRQKERVNVKRRDFPNVNSLEESEIFAEYDQNEQEIVALIQDHSLVETLIEDIKNNDVQLQQLQEKLAGLSELRKKLKKGKDSKAQQSLGGVIKEQDSLKTEIKQCKIKKSELEKQQGYYKPLLEWLRELRERNEVLNNAL